MSDAVVMDPNKYRLLCEEADEQWEVERLVAHDSALRARVAELEGALAEIRGRVVEPCWAQDWCRQTAELPCDEWCARCIASAALGREIAEEEGVSLDVYLECACSCHTDEHDCTLWRANVTHNLYRMAEAANIYKALWRPGEIGITKAAQLVPLLTDGLALLRAEPQKFRTFDPPNRWGDYDGLVEFVERYLKACVAHPDATVRVRR